MPVRGDLRADGHQGQHQRRHADNICPRSRRRPFRVGARFIICGCCRIGRCCSCATAIRYRTITPALPDTHCRTHCRTYTHDRPFSAASNGPSAATIVCAATATSAGPNINTNGVRASRYTCECACRAHTIPRAAH